MKKDEIFFFGIACGVLGIGWGSFFEWPQASFFLLGSAFFFAAGVVFRLKDFVFVGVGVLVFFFGTTLALQERATYQSLPIYTEPVSGTVRIVADPEEKDFFRRVIVRFEHCESQECPSADVLWQAPLSFRMLAGARFPFRCNIERPENFSPDFDYQMFLAKSGIGYICLKGDSGEQYPVDWSGKLRAWLYVPKHVMERALSEILPEPEAGLSKGLLLGGDAYLPQALKESFTRVGLSHMIAVSGYNMTLIAEMFLAVGLALGLWRKQAIWTALVGIVFFIFMIGMQASAARAGAMAGIVFMAFQSGRLVHPVRTLLFAAGVMLFFNPLLFRYDMGFQLSFLATLGILVLMPYCEYIAPKQRLLKKGFEILCMTLAVELFVLPLILFSFHTFSPLIVIGNFLILLVPFAMATAFVSVLLFLVVPGLQVVIAWSAFVFLTVITRSVEWLGSWTEMSIDVGEFGIWHLLGWYAILGIFVAVISRVFPPQKYEKDF